MKKFIEDIGRFTGEQIGAPLLERQRRKIEQFNLEITGQNNLESLRDAPFVLAANHLMPENSSTQQSQLSPDAFVLEKLVKDLNNQELKIISKCDDGWWAENIYRYFQKYVGQPFGKGMQEGMGFVPIYKNPGTFNRDFIKTVDGVIQDEESPILIFPEGHWYEDFSPEHKLEAGAAYIAKKYKLPILTAYIKGAHSWEPNTSVRVAFSEPFNSKQLNREQATEQIRLRLTKLHEIMTNE